MKEDWNPAFWILLQAHTKHTEFFDSSFLYHRISRDKVGEKNIEGSFEKNKRLLVDLLHQPGEVLNLFFSSIAKEKSMWEQLPTKKIYLRVCSDANL